MSNSLNWETIRTFLAEKLNKTEHIMTFGTFGSCNIDHDIDLIITKKPISSISGFFKEIHTLFENLDEFLYSNYKRRALRFSSSAEEFLIINLLKTGKKPISFHTHVYITYPQMKRDWGWAIFDDFKMDEFIKKEYKCLKGNVNDIFSKDFQKKSYYDPIYIFLYLYDKINSHYPERLLIEAMNSFFDYLYRKRLGLSPPIAKNKSEVKRYFYDFCDKLDELRRKRDN